MLLSASVIFVMKIKTGTRIIGRHFQRTRTRIIVIQKTKTKLETKASSHEGQCIPAGSSVSLPRMVLITIYVNNNHA